MVLGLGRSRRWIHRAGARGRVAGRLHDEAPPSDAGPARDAARSRVSPRPSRLAGLLGDRPVRPAGHHGGRGLGRHLELGYRDALRPRRRGRCPRRSRDRRHAGRLHGADRLRRHRGVDLRRGRQIRAGRGALAGCLPVDLLRGRIGRQLGAAERGPRPDGREHRHRGHELRPPRRNLRHGEGDGAPGSRLANITFGTPGSASSRRCSIRRGSRFSTSRTSRCSRASPLSPGPPARTTS